MEKTFTFEDARKVAELAEATRGAYDLTMLIEGTDGRKYRVTCEQGARDGLWDVELAWIMGGRLGFHEVDLYRLDVEEVPDDHLR